MCMDVHIVHILAMLISARLYRLCNRHRHRHRNRYRYKNNRIICKAILCVLMYNCCNKVKIISGRCIWHCNRWVLCWPNWIYYCIMDLPLYLLIMIVVVIMVVVVLNIIRNKYIIYSNVITINGISNMYIHG